MTIMFISGKTIKNSNSTVNPNDYMCNFCSTQKQSCELFSSEVISFFVVLHLQ